MISILIPTYGRPQNIVMFTETANVTAANPSEIEILFGVHADDAKSIKTIRKVGNRVKISVLPVIIKKYEDGLPHLSYFWNQIYTHAKYPIVGFFGDDVKMKTQSWDKIVKKEFAKDPYILVYGDDVHCAHGTCATLFFTHKKSHEAFGFYMPPYFRRSWMDQFMDNVFRSAGKIVYRKDLVTEHVHPGKFTERMDETYRRLERARPKDVAWGKCNSDFKKCVGILRATNPKYNKAL